MGRDVEARDEGQQPVTAVADAFRLDGGVQASLLLVEAAEDAEDRAILARKEERERAIGVDTARRDYMPGELVSRMLAGEHPVRLWREQRKLSLRELAARSGVGPSYLSEIESGRKPGSVKAPRELAQASNSLTTSPCTFVSRRRRPL